MLGNDAPTDAEVAPAGLVLSGGNVVGNEFSIAGVPQPIIFTIDDVFASVVEIDPDGTPGNGDEFDAGLLADNGGPVQTIALKDDALNPAIDAGGDTLAPDLDARGLARADFAGAAHNGTNISDLGAFETVGLDPLIVATLEDTVDPFDGAISLREAIEFANINPGADTITFDASLAGGTITLASELPILDSDITIDGGLNDITISGAGQFRGFFIGAWEPGTATQIPVNVTIENFTIADAVAQGGDGGSGSGFGAPAAAPAWAARSSSPTSPM